MGSGLVKKIPRSYTFPREKGDLRRGIRYAGMLEFALSFHETAFLANIDRVVALPAGAERYNAVLCMCKDYLWLENESDVVFERDWFNWMAIRRARRSRESVYKEVMRVPEAYSCYKGVEERG